MNGFDDKNLVILCLSVLAIAAMGVFLVAVVWLVPDVATIDKIATLTFGVVSSIVSGLLGVAVGRLQK